MRGRKGLICVVGGRLGACEVLLRSWLGGFLPVDIVTRGLRCARMLERCVRLERDGTLRPPK